MLDSKEQLKYYLEKDREKLGRKRKKPFLGDEIWKFQIALRKHEYYLNSKRNKLLLQYWKYRHHKLGIKLGFTIPCNCFGAGLNIHHYGCIVVNSHAKIGENCNIQQGVNIGKNYSAENVPTIGNNVYIGPGAKLFGKINIANGCVIGANAVVTKSCNEENMVLVGVPAKIVGRRKEGLV